MLSQKEKDLTFLAYAEKFFVYATLYEFSQEMLLRTEDGYLADFIVRAKVLNPNGWTLVLGSGGGSDALRLLLEGFGVYAVDYLPESMNALNRMTTLQGADVVIKHPKFKSLVSNILYLDKDFAFEEFESILIESCLQHINHHEVIELLEKANGWLKQNGFVLFRLKVTPDGSVYSTNTLGATRFYSSWTLEQIEELKDQLTAVGYEIDLSSQKLTHHKDHDLGVPDFYSLVIYKRSVAAHSTPPNQSSASEVQLNNLTSF